MYELDAIDKRILEALQDDAKINIKDLADKLKLTKTPVYERIRRLEKEGIIRKYIALINKDYIERRMVVFCSVSLESQQLERIKAFAKAVSSIPEVMECYLLGGANDFMLKVMVKDLDAYHQFSSGILAALPNVAQIKSTFVLNEVKHTNAYPLSI
ncbi:MAG: Lrp/AsnC family transcriptional regulator [Saprospiraceae bacterium]|nr:Lrp/AsnC family transcriptional regulator [Saprospiraceae bacterium]